LAGVIDLMLVKLLDGLDNLFEIGVDLFSELITFEG
jgi:hypothetical protein